MTQSSSKPLPPHTTKLQGDQDEPKAKSQKPKVQKGFNHEDSRGLLAYNNSLDLSQFKRLHVIETSLEQPFRGWQGHEFESKIFITIFGKIRFGAIRVEDWKNPNPLESITLVELDLLCADAFFIPGRYANSILSLEAASKALVLSSSALEESLLDNDRIEANFLADLGVKSSDLALW